MLPVRLTRHVETAYPYVPCGSFAGKAKWSTLQWLGSTTEIKTFKLQHDVLYTTVTAIVCYQNTRKQWQTNS